MTQPSIVIVDYGVGNTYSVLNAIRSLNYRRVKISNQPNDFFAADALILPGVGAFKTCISNLRQLHLDEILNEAVLAKHKPILGICLGMQLMADVSEENGLHTGLGWIPGRVVKLNLPSSYVVPHVGWNDLQVNKESSLFSRTDEASHFYFDHSYHYECSKEFVVATSNYDQPITAAIAYKNIHGVQFHPEKSQTSGLKLFRGFFNAVDQC